MFKAIIIDDVQQAREILRKDIEQYCPNLEIVGEADGVVSGLKAIKANEPDIVFLDIEMQDGDGFDLLELSGNYDFKVIFITGDNSQAIRAFRFSAVDYLLKPVSSDELLDAVEKAIQDGVSKQESYSLLKETISNEKVPKRIALHTLEKIQIVPIQEITRCESSGNYTTFYFTDTSKLLVTKTLKEFDNLLSAGGFARVHQSHLININQVKEYVKMDGGYIVMRDGSNVPVSSRKRATIVSLLSEVR